MAKKFWTFLDDKLEERSRAGLLRTLSQPLEIDFSSNDYLGLANQLMHVELLPSGAGASRLIRGNHAALIALEAYLASFYKCNEAVVFESGYSANHTLFSALSQQGIAVLYDELVHASIRDSLTGTRSKTWAYKHNDVDHLEKLLLKIDGPVAVVTEGLFSMDGDFGCVADIARLKNKFDFALIVDEAHATGWRGPNNLGESDNASVAEAVDIRIHTFGKALGGSGACLAASGNLRDFLINFGRPLIYSTAISPMHCAYIQAIHERVQGADDLRLRLKEAIALFNESTSTLAGICGDLASPIKYFGSMDVASLKRIAETLKGQKVDARLILSPTVPAGKERIRICLHAFNTKHDIDLLVRNLQKSYISLTN